MFRLYEILTFVDVSNLRHAKNVFHIVRKLQNSIKNDFYNTDYNIIDKKNDYKMFLSIFKFYLIQKFNNQNVEIIKVIDNKKTNICYLLFEDVFKEKYYFVVYNIEQESIVLSDNRMIETLSGRGVPDYEQSFDLLYVKKQTIDKNKIIKTVFLVILVLFLLLSLIYVYPIIKNTIVKQPPPPPPPPPKVYSKEELKSVKIEQWHKIVDKWQQIIKEVSQVEGIIIKHIIVNILDVDKQTSKTSYKIEVVKSYVYPEIDTKREQNNLYTKTEVYNENIEFNKLILLPEWNQEVCIKTLLQYFDVIERKQNEIIFESTTFDLTLQKGINFPLFLQKLQEVCGYNLIITSFGLDSERNVVYINDNIKLILE